MGLDLLNVIINKWDNNRELSFDKFELVKKIENGTNILGMLIVFPIFIPEIIFASVIWFSSLVTVTLVPLQSHSDWFKFLINIIVVNLQFHGMVWQTWSFQTA